MAAQPPPQLPPCHRAPSSCDRHPAQRVTGFCGACLRERLEGLDPASRRLSASSPPSGASAALRALFPRPSALPSAFQLGHTDPAVRSASSLGPELRRCRSFSGRPPPFDTPATEPQRRSCDVRARTTLGSLFYLADSGGADGQLQSLETPLEPSSWRLGPIYFAGVPEAKEEEDDNEVDGGNAVEVSEERRLEENDRREDLNPSPAEDSKEEPPKSFWLAASVFSKKLHAWRMKQKLRKHAAQRVPGDGVGCSGQGPRRDKPSFVFPFSSRSRRFFRGTPSRGGEEGLRRRSCDTDPRCSLDAGRMSVDDTAFFSWDEPRVSWDGHLVGFRPAPPRQRPMLPLAEDAPASIQIVPRLDGHIPVEEDGCALPGGAAQTRDYYLSASQRRTGRRSLDRASLLAVRRSFSVEGDESGRTAALPTNFVRSSSSSTEYDVEEHALGGNRIGSEAGKEGGPGKARRRWGKAWSLWGFLIHALARGGVSASESGSAPRRRPFAEPPRHSCSSLSSRDGPDVSTKARKQFAKERPGEVATERSRSGRLSPCGVLEGGVLSLYVGRTRPPGRRIAASAGATLQAVHPHALYLY